jgi:hypothetical protein
VGSNDVTRITNIIREIVISMLNNKSLSARGYHITVNVIAVAGLDLLSALLVSMPLRLSIAQAVSSIYGLPCIN